MKNYLFVYVYLMLFLFWTVQHSGSDSAPVGIRKISHHEHTRRTCHDYSAYLWQAFWLDISFKVFVKTSTLNTLRHVRLFFDQLRVFAAMMQ